MDFWLDVFIKEMDVFLSQPHAINIKELKQHVQTLLKSVGMLIQQQILPLVLKDYANIILPTLVIPLALISKMAV